LLSNLKQNKMKKTLLSAIVILAFGFANAQDKAGKDGMKFGVKAGANLASVAGDGYNDTDGTAGFFVGGLVDMPLAGNFHLQPELMFSMEGADNASISYVRIPVMAKYYIMDGLSAQAGPEIALKVSSENDDIKSLDYGLGIGAGYELPMGIFAEARYNLGLADISKVTGTQSNAAFQIGIGYRF
jgi:hypothetical protein